MKRPNKKMSKRLKAYSKEQDEYIDWLESNRDKCCEVVKDDYKKQIKKLKAEANKQEKLAKHWYDKFFELRAKTESKL